MSRTCLNFNQNPIQDAISRIRFAPHSNNLLISSWDSVLRLYDVDDSVLRLETTTEAALLDCCFADDSVAFSSASDGSICRHDLQSGNLVQIGSHGDLATCVEYSLDTSLTVTAGWDKKIVFWDTRCADSVGCVRNLLVEMESMSLSGYHLMVAVGTSVNTYDLRNLRNTVKESNMDVRIKCVRSIHGFAGYAVGSYDGRVVLEYFSEPKLGTGGYAFRCHPKLKDGRHHLVTVNDISFSPCMPGAFVTGDDRGNVISWDAKIKKRLFELQGYPNSVVSLSYNHSGLLFAVASSHSCQEANEREGQPQILIHQMNDSNVGYASAGSSK